MTTEERRRAWNGRMVARLPDRHRHALTAVYDMLDAAMQESWKEHCPVRWYAGFPVGPFKIRPDVRVHYPKVLITENRTRWVVVIRPWMDSCYLRGEENTKYWWIPKDALNDGKNGLKLLNEWLRSTWQHNTDMPVVIGAMRDWLMEQGIDANIGVAQTFTDDRYRLTGRSKRPERSYPVRDVLNLQPYFVKEEYALTLFHGVEKEFQGGDTTRVFSRWTTDEERAAWFERVKGACDAWTRSIESTFPTGPETREEYAARFGKATEKSIQEQYNMYQWALWFAIEKE